LTAVLELAVPPRRSDDDPPPNSIGLIFQRVTPLRPRQVPGFLRFSLFDSPEPSMSNLIAAIKTGTDEESTVTIQRKLRN